MKLVIAFVCFFAVATARLQRYSVKGKVICQSDPAKAKNVVVKLIDKDFGADDTLDTGRTNNNGEFHLTGQTSEVTTIDPVLKIYHDCNDKVGNVEKPCQRRYNSILPKSFVNGNTPYDAGTINLDAKQSSEERDCSH